VFLLGVGEGVDHGTKLGQRSGIALGVMASQARDSLDVGGGEACRVAGTDLVQRLPLGLLGQAVVGDGCH
jgi:hypothetical protein